MTFSEPDSKRQLPRSGVTVSDVLGVVVSKPVIHMVHISIAVMTRSCGTDGMDHSPIRQTFELGKFISTAGKSIINLVKL